jgi:hypothetical protein
MIQAAKKSRILSLFWQKLRFEVVEIKIQDRYS